MAVRQADAPAVQSLEGFKQRAVFLDQQLVRHVQPVIGIDADQVPVEGRVMNLGEKQAVLDDGLSQRLVLVGDDVGGVEQLVLGQPGDRATPVVGRQYGLSKRGLVEPLLDQLKAVTALGFGMRRGDDGLPGRPECQVGFQG